MDVSSRAVELKKTLKRWEKAFYDTHDRKASRADINDAPKRIQDAYREYNDLKKVPDGTSVSAVTKDKLETISGGTWGAHLNQSNRSTPDKQSSVGQTQEQGNILRQYSRKLQHTASSSKLPKTPSYRRAGSSSDTSKTFSKEAIPVNLSDDDLNSKQEVISHKLTGSIFSCLQDSKISFTSSSQRAKVSREDVTVGLLRKKPPKKPSLKMEWLDDCEQDLLAGVKSLATRYSESTRGVVDNHSEAARQNQDNIWDGESSRKPGQKIDEASKSTLGSCVLTSDDSIENAAHKDRSYGGTHSSETEQGSKLTKCDNRDNRSKTATKTVLEVDVSGNRNLKQLPRADSKTPERGNPHVSLLRKCKASPGVVAMETSDDTVSNSRITAAGSPQSAFSPLSNPSKTKKSVSPLARSPRKLSDDPASIHPANRTDIVTKAQDEDSHHKSSSSKEDENVSKFCRKPSLRTGNLHEKSEQDILRNEVDMVKEEQDEIEQVPEYTIKDKKSVPSKKSAPSTSRKPSSASAPGRSNLNENFVKLEMKKKRYSRKGLFHMKGEAYKRQIWKKKMAGSGGLGLSGRGGWTGGGRGGRGRGRGGFNMANPTDKCFKCGQTGHWASRCMGFQPDEKKAEIKEEDFPTLEEAAMAARGIKNTPDGNTEAAGVDVVPEVSVETVYDFPPPPPPIEPLLELPSDGKPGEAPSCVYKALRQMGYSSFRPGQEQAVMRILSGLSTLVVLSTGAGKSLVYQLASLMYSQRAPCITLVISPLVSLMDDQVGGLPDCLRGVRLHSNMTKPQREKVVKEIQAGHVNILLVSPEAIVSGSGGTGGGCMPALAQLPPIAFACIDEVHCLSEWSHNFRPSYLMLCKVLRDRLGVQCMLGLTATATMATAQSVAQHLGIADDPDAIIRGTCLPDNLLLSSSRDANRERALVELLKSPRFSHLPSIIIYCIRREETERVASLLRTCLPDEELHPLLMQDNNEETVNDEECENGKMVAMAKRNSEDEESRAGVDKKDGTGKEEHSDTTKNPNPVLDKVEDRLSERETGHLEKKEDSDKTAFEDTKMDETLNQELGKRRGRKRKTVPTKDENHDTKSGIVKKRRKCKRVESETDGDDEYSFKDEDTDDVPTAKRRKSKTGQSTKKKATATTRKSKKMTSKAALKGVRVVTGVNSVEAYHAGMTAAARRRVQTAFMTGRLRIVVATVAFGMGLDKSDVRAVLHFNLPKSFESYVQEIGRAGRDRKPAHCHVFLEPQGKDLCELRRHTYANTVDRYCIKKLVSKIFPPCKCRQAKRLYQSSGADGSAVINSNDDDQMASSEISDELFLAAMEDFETRQAQAEDQPTSFSSKRPFGKRLCKGHLVAVPIDSTVQELDIKEEGISTLLCYLELHPKRWLVTLPSTYATCTLQCYGGPSQLQQIAQSCPPVAAAIAKSKQRGKTFRHASSVEFDVVEVARCMGWDLSVVKKELRRLQWRQVMGKGWVKSGVTVEFSNLAFLLLAPGDLEDEEQDELVRYLTGKSSSQEKRELNQLQAVHTALHDISYGNYWDCSDAVNVERSDSLKVVLRDYFARPLSEYIAEAWRNDTADRSQGLSRGDQFEVTAGNAGRARGDIRQFLSMHTDRSFSGRAVARILHGIASPCYPAQVWGRDRRFWRAHLDVDFNLLLKMATEEILRLR